VLDGYLGAFALPASMSHGSATLTRRVPRRQACPSSVYQYRAMNRFTVLLTLTMHHMLPGCMVDYPLGSKPRRPCHVHMQNRYTLDGGHHARLQSVALQARARDAAMAPEPPGADLLRERRARSPVGDARPARPGAPRSRVRSSAPEQELAAAPWPALSRLTSLSMSAKGNLESSTEARYLWLRWALPAAPQLRKLPVGGVDDPFEGVSTPPAPEQYRCIKVSPVPGASLLEHSATAPRRCQISCHSW